MHVLGLFNTHNMFLNILLGYALFNVLYILRLLIVFFIAMKWWNGLSKSEQASHWFRYPFVVIAGIFIVFDVLYRWIMVTWTLPVSFILGPWDFKADWPNSWKETVSECLGDYMAYRRHDDWRYKFAAFFCRIMTKADPNHCQRMKSKTNPG